MVRLIEGIDNTLLDVPVQLIVQRIDTYRLLKYLFKIITYFRQRECNNGKARLHSRYIGIGNRHRFVRIGKQQFLLLFT